MRPPWKRAEPCPFDSASPGPPQPCTAMPRPFKKMKSTVHTAIRPLAMLGLAILGAACSALTLNAPTPRSTPTSAPLPMRPPNDSWILVDLPPDATQLQHGAEIYRLVCSACHALSGEGLTDAWRATWAPGDQNCWQSKCHGKSHPADGFELPIAPPVVGDAALAPFQTAADLRAFIQRFMPWQDPGNLTEEEGWAVTAYVIKLNRMNPGPELNAENAAQLDLHPGAAAIPPTSIPQGAGSIAALAWMNPWVLGAVAAVAFALAFAIRAARQRSSGGR